MTQRENKMKISCGAENFSLLLRIPYSLLINMS